MAAVAGVGHAVPDTVVANAEIARRLGVDEAWIESRTGTRERRALRDGERLGDLAARDDLRLRMDGPGVFRHAVRLMDDVTHEAAAAAGVALGDIDLFVYHQANS